MKRILFVLLLAACCGLVSAAVAHSLFQEANIAYSKGRYKDAAKLYKAAIREEGLSAELLANLADSYAADGQTGLAVLNYKRALLLAPVNAETKAALAEVRQKAGLDWEEQPLHERLAALLGANQWLLLSGTAFVLLSLTVLTAGLLGRRRFPQASRLSAGLLLLVLLPLPLAWLRYQDWQDGVVTAESAKMLISPFAGAETLHKLPAGSMIRPLGKKHEHYVLVRDKDGHSGWLYQGSFQLIADQP